MLAIVDIGTYFCFWQTILLLIATYRGESSVNSGQCSFLGSKLTKDKVSCKIVKQLRQAKQQRNNTKKNSLVRSSSLSRPLKELFRHFLYGGQYFCLKTNHWSNCLSRNQGQILIMLKGKPLSPPAYCLSLCKYYEETFLKSFISGANV